MHEQQLSEFMAGLSETNRRIWEEWANALQSTHLGGGEQVDKLYQQNLEAMEKLIHQTLQAEAQWLDQWHEGLKQTPHAPAPMLNVFDGVHSTMRAMLSHRAQMWDALLKQARGMSFDQIPSVVLGSDTQNTLSRIWEEFYQQAVNAQQQLTGQVELSATITPKPAAAQSAPRPSAPKPATPPSQPAASKPQPAAAKPQPVAAKPQPAAAKPQAAAAKPQPAAAKAPTPAATPAAKPQPAAKAPAAKPTGRAKAASKPAAAQNKAAAAKPAAAQAKPATARAKPAAAKAPAKAGKSAKKPSKGG